MESGNLFQTVCVGQLDNPVLWITSCLCTQRPWKERFKFKLFLS